VDNGAGNSNRGVMRFRVQAILFDIDGTLVDSTDVVTRTWRFWAGKYGVDLDEVLRVCHGRRTEDTVALFVPDDRRAAAAAELEELEMNDMEGIVALPGTQALLPRLPMTRWAAVTSGSQALMRRRLNAAGLPTPSVLISGDDVTTGKPDPEGYLKASAELGYDIAQCLVVEDAPAGIEAGRASGAHTVAVATSHDASDLEDADSVIPDLTTLALQHTATGLVIDVAD
jgi:mannitol-1-/sugar-/sorbitol-6-phosphatase